MTMPGGGWGNPVVGGTVLRIPAIQSPNFLAGVSGWEIRQDGSVEFNNGTFRGTISGGTLIISQGSGATFEQFEIDGSTGITTWSKYQSPTVVIRQILADGTDLTYNDPGSGNPQGALLISQSSTTGTALDGTNYGHGIFFWQPGTSAIGISAVGGQPVLDMSAPNRVHLTADAELFTQTVNAGSANEYVITVLSSGKESGNDDAALQLFCESADATIPAQAVIEFGGAIAVTVTRSGVVSGSSLSGTMQVTDGIDGQVYNTQISTIVSGGTSGTTLFNVFTATMGARTYRIHGKIFFNIGTTSTLNFKVIGPGSPSGNVGVTVIRGTAVNAGFSYTGFNANSTISGSITNNNGFIMDIDGTITLASSGTFTIQIGESTGTCTVVAGSFLDIIPV